MVCLRLENLEADANLESVISFAAIFAAYPLHTQKACIYLHINLAIPDSFGSSMSWFPQDRLRHTYNSISDSVLSSPVLRTPNPSPSEISFLFMATKLETLRRLAWFLFGSDDILFRFVWLTWITSGCTALEFDGELSIVVALGCRLLDAEGSRETIVSCCWLLDSEDSRGLTKIDSGLATCLSRTTFKSTFWYLLHFAMSSPSWKALSSDVFCRCLTARLSLANIA